jgi:hypothetical protein
MNPSKAPLKLLMPTLPHVLVGMDLAYEGKLTIRVGFSLPSKKPKLDTHLFDLGPTNIPRGFNENLTPIHSKNGAIRISEHGSFVCK